MREGRGFGGCGQRESGSKAPRCNGGTWRSRRRLTNTSTFESADSWNKITYTFIDGTAPSWEPCGCVCANRLSKVEGYKALFLAWLR